MFDFDASKLLIIGVVALVVIGPKDLPRVLRQVGQMVSKLRRMAAEFQGQFMDAMKEADLADIKQEVSKLKASAALDVVFNPVQDIKDSVERSVGSTASPPMTPSLEAAATGGEPAAADLVGTPLPAAASPALAGVSGPDPGPVFLEPAFPAHHTPAAAAGAVHAVEADAGDAGRRRILVPKRRPPGDRLGSRAAFTSRGRTLLPPRRDPRP